MPLLGPRRCIISVLTHPLSLYTHSGVATATGDVLSWTGQLAAVSKRASTEAHIRPLVASVSTQLS